MLVTFQRFLQNTMRGDGATLAVSFPQFFGHPLERHIAPRHAFLVASGRPSGGERVCYLCLLYNNSTFKPRDTIWHPRNALELSVCIAPNHVCPALFIVYSNSKGLWLLCARTMILVRSVFASELGELAKQGFSR